MKKNSMWFLLVLSFFLRCTSLGNTENAGLLHEYEKLLEQLKNYNNPGFFIIHDDSLWERGVFFDINFDAYKEIGMEPYTKICLTPIGKGFFQFFDEIKEKPIYCRNAILNVNHEGIMCNLDGYPLYPVIKINKQWPYKMDYKNGKLIIEYYENDIIEEHMIFLYWPQKPIRESLYGVYFFFDDAGILNDARILSGFIELSAVNINSTLIKMINLIPEINAKYTDSVIFKSGSAESTLTLLQSLLIASYIVKFDPPILKPDDYQIIYGNTLAFPNQYLPKTIIDNDPLEIGTFYDYLRIILRNN